MIDTPGIHLGVTADEYHRDPLPEPSASASILHTLQSRSPLHAWHRHPRLNPGWEPSRDTAAQAFGKAVHALLTGSDEVCEVAFDDWRTKDARAARDDALARGAIPLLSDDLVTAKNMVRALRKGLQGHELGDVFDDGQAEATLAWRDDGVWLRGRIDWWKPRQGLIVDYKTTEGSADPDMWSRRLFEFGADFQAVLYPEGVAVATGERVRFVDIVQEVAPPHAFSVLTLDEAAREFTTNRLADAFHTWRECLRTGRWPGYPAHLCHVAAPAWAVKREENRALARQASREIVVVPV